MYLKAQQWVSSTSLSVCNMCPCCSGSLQHISYLSVQVSYQLKENPQVLADWGLSYTSIFLTKQQYSNCLQKLRSHEIPEDPGHMGLQLFNMCIWLSIGLRDRGVDFILANIFSFAAAVLKGWNHVPTTVLLIVSFPPTLIMDKQIQSLEKTHYFTIKVYNHMGKNNPIRKQTKFFVIIARNM